MAAAAAWVFRDVPAVSDATRQLQSSSIGRWVGQQAASLTSGHGGQGRAAGTAGLHKCAGESGVTYTNGSCPPGTRRLDVDGGTLTVLPAVRVAPGATAAAPGDAASGGARGPLADLAGQPLKGTLKDKALENIQ